MILDDDNELLPKRKRKGKYLKSFVKKQQKIPKEDINSPSVIRSRRENISIQKFPLGIRSFYDYLSRRVGARKWRYICSIRSIAETKPYKMSYFIHNMIKSNYDHNENNFVKTLREYNIKNIHCCPPYFALSSLDDLVVVRFVLGKDLVFVYDLFDNEILMKNIDFRVI